MARVEISSCPSICFTSIACTTRPCRVPSRVVRCALRSLPDEYVLAIDVGTSGTKAALISSHGTVAFSAFSPHPPPSPVMGMQASAEQDPCSWWIATKDAIKKCIHNSMLKECGINSSSIQALAITGQMQDVIIVPQVGLDFQRQAILYSDARAVSEANEVANILGGENNVARLTGSKQGATSLLAKLRWLDKHDPDAFHQCQHLLLGGHDYITWKLSQVCITDATTASTTGLTDTNYQYAESLLESLQLDHWLQKLPPIFPPDAPCGEVTREAAEELGCTMLKGIPVLHCCGDNGSCSLGAGAGVPGSLYAYLGTSGWVAGSFPLNSYQRKGGLVPGVFTLAHPDPSLVFKTGSIMTAGGNLAWAGENLYFPTSTGKFCWESVDHLAANAPVGSRGLLYLPFINGERCPFQDAEARAAFIGISSSTSSMELFRSVMEGVAFALRSARDSMIDSQSLGVIIAGSLRLVGGGARSPVWPMILANVFEQTVDVLENAQDVGVIGAALVAGKWLGWHSTLSADGDWLKVRKTIFPSSQDVEIYQRMYGAYNDAYINLKNTFKALSRIPHS